MSGGAETRDEMRQDTEQKGNSQDAFQTVSQQQKQGQKICRRPLLSAGIKQSKKLGVGQPH